MAVAEWKLDRPQTFGEEIANGVSHGLALLGAAAALPILIVAAAGSGAAQVVGVTIFAATMVLLYLASTLYHVFPPGRVKRVFRVLDHSAIYVLIAGTYTPFTLGPLAGPWGWTLFGATWGLAALGVLGKATGRLRRPWVSTALYLLMGWLALVAVGPLAANVGLAGVAWLVAGGAAYTLGAVFFALDSRLRYAHFVWHVFVVMGTVCHFFAVLRFAI